MGATRLLQRDMKRFLAFYGNRYYPSKGMGDLLDDFDTVAQAIRAIEEKKEQEGWSWDIVYACVWDSVSKDNMYDK